MAPANFPSPDPFAPAADLLQDVLAVSLTAINLLRPIYDPTGSAELVDFALEYLNPAAQRMTGLPERPGGTLRTHFPATFDKGVFAFYQRVFETREAGRYDLNYQDDSLDNYFRLAARRSGERLVVSFTDTADQPRTPVEVALRAAQAAERAARAEAETQRQQVEQLNRKLEARVRERTREAEAARAEADEQRHRLQRLFGQAPAHINLFSGPTHIWTLVHPRTQELLPTRTLLGLPRRQALPELPEAQHVPFDRVYRTGQPEYQFAASRRLARSDNEELSEEYFDITIQPKFDAAGQVEGVMSFAVNVTERVRAQQQAEALQAEVLAVAQQQAREREALYHILADAPAAVAVLRGPEHRFEYVNAAYQQFFPERQLTGQPVAEALPETREAGFLTILDRVYRTGETFFGQEMGMLLQPVDGHAAQQAYYTFTYQAYREASEIAGISIFAFDVTEQVLARRERENQQKRLYSLFEEAPVAIAIFRGLQYVIELANPAVCAIWGRTPAQALGTPLFELLPEAAGQGFEQQLDAVMATGVPFVAHELPALIDRHGRRDTVYMNFVYQPLHEGTAPVTAVTVVAVEVTDQVLARQVVERSAEQAQAQADALAMANRQLTRTNADLDNFIYTASHDLKAPISNIEGLLYLLQEELPDAEAQAAVSPVLARMLEAVERFKRTIDHLTEVSKLQKEHGPAATLVNLAAVVEDVRQDLLPQLQAAGAKLSVAVAATPPIPFAEKNLRSIVYNLLSNAVKYRHPDRTPHIDVRAHVRPHHTVLEVHDNGLGLDPAHLPRLFTMFQRFHDHVEGTGIGLYMINRMVENAGGRIEVHSQLGAGTTFFVFLPHTTNPAGHVFPAYLPA